MKTTIFKIFLPVLSLSFLLSSCLGDNESKVSATNAFVYIKEHAGEKVAIIDGYYVGITHENLNRLSVGDCAYVDFKFTDANHLGDGIYKADYANINQDEDFDFTLNSQQRVHVAAVDTTQLSDSINVFVSLNKGSEYIYPDMGNRMLFTYSYRAYENEEVYIEFYYDSTKQAEKEGGATPAYGIIDVRLRKTTLPGNPQGNVANRTKFVVVDFSNVYSTFERYSSEYSSSVIFRYYKFYGSGYPLRAENLNAYMLYNTNE